MFHSAIPSLPADFPPLLSPQAPRHNLPAQSYQPDWAGGRAGRGAGPAGDGRLVTLTGPGGMGKTRLALAVAAELVDQYPDGVWFVELAPMVDPLLVRTVAQVLGVREEPGRSLSQALADHLKDRQLSWCWTTANK